MYDIDKKKPIGIIDDLKKKLIEWLIDYSKQKINESRYDIAKYVEKQIEKKIKTEIKNQIRKYSFIFFALLFFIIGGLVLIYGIFELIFYLLNVPEVFLNLTYSIFILIIGFILYLNFR